MTDRAQTEGKKDTRYTLIGIVQKPVVRKDRNNNDWVAFELHRDGKTTVRCVAFGARAAAIIQGFAEGAAAKVWGYFEKRPFVTRDGKSRTQQSFNLLHVSVPGKAETEESAQAQAA